MSIFKEYSVQDIKDVRARFECGLREAKLICERHVVNKAISRLKKDNKIDQDLAEVLDWLVQQV